MGFKLRPEVDDWFSKISKGNTPLTTKFDYYYLCLMMGFAKRKAAAFSGGTEFIGSFINEYRPVQNLLIGLLVAAEAKRQGIDLTNRAAIKKLLSLYVSPEASLGLTSEGFQRMNEYANGGFNSIVSVYPEAPWVPADFLVWYHHEIQQSD